MVLHTTISLPEVQSMDNIIINILDRPVQVLDMSSVNIPESWLSFPLTLNNYLPSGNMRQGHVNTLTELTRSIAISDQIFTGIDMNWLWERRYEERFFNYIENYFLHPLYHIDVSNLCNAYYSQLVNTRKRIAELRLK